MKNNQQIKDEIYNEYCIEGMQAAFDLAHVYNLPYAYCNGCEALVPHVNHECVICGQGTVKPEEL